MSLSLSAHARDPYRGSKGESGFNWLWQAAPLGHRVWGLPTPSDCDDSTQVRAKRELRILRPLF